MTKGRTAPKFKTSPHGPPKCSPDDRPLPVDCTSKGLLDPADKLLPQRQLPQTLAPGLADVLQQPFGTDELLADPVQFLVAKLVEDSLGKSLEGTARVRKTKLSGARAASGTRGTETPTMPTAPPPRLPGVTGTQSSGHCVDWMPQLPCCPASIHANYDPLHLADG